MCGNVHMWTNQMKMKKKKNKHAADKCDKPREYSVTVKHTFLVACMAEYPRGFKAATPHGWFVPRARRSWHFATTA